MRIFLFMTIKERFEKLIQHFSNGNKRAFAEMIGVAPTVIENIVGKREGNPSFDILQKTIFAIEDLNTEWLLTGNGQMLKNNQIIGDVDNSNIVGANVNGTGIHINGASSELVDVIKKQQEQMDKLIEIINKLSGK
jgi:hypothetical protein